GEPLAMTEAMLRIIKMLTRGYRVLQRAARPLQCLGMRLLNRDSERVEGDRAVHVIRPLRGRELGRRCRRWRCKVAPYLCASWQHSQKHSQSGFWLLSGWSLAQISHRISASERRISESSFARSTFR